LENFTTNRAQQLTPTIFTKGKGLENTRYSYLHPQYKHNHSATALPTSGGIDELRLLNRVTTSFLAMEACTFLRLFNHQFGHNHLKTILSNNSYDLFI
ncbi:hypothetical protein RBK84_00180, partial [Pseudomonas aeruginosa]|uniref:hypothetical protein n=1 Tax=Pseudomonas aeruginosa TaxID=287 RepID=UPI0027D35786